MVQKLALKAMHFRKWLVNNLQLLCLAFPHGLTEISVRKTESIYTVMYMTQMGRSLGSKLLGWGITGGACMWSLPLIMEWEWWHCHWVMGVPFLQLCLVS